MSRYGLRRNLLAVVGNGIDHVDGAFELMVEHPPLRVFPLGAMVVSLVVGVGFVTSYRAIGRPIWFWLVGHGVGPYEAMAPTAYALVFLFFAAETAVLSFANAGLVHCTNQVIEGESPSVRAGLRAALGVLPQVLTYAVVTGAAGVVVAWLERRTDFVDGLVAAVLGLSYGMFTFFVVPAAVLDGASALSMFLESGRTVRAHLGGLATVYLGVTLLVVTVFSIPLFLAIVVVTVNGVLGFVDYAALVDWLAGVLEVSTHRSLTIWTALVYAVVVLPAWVGFVLASSLSSMAKTSLYVAIHEDADAMPLFDVDRDDALVVPDYGHA